MHTITRNSHVNSTHQIFGITWSGTNINYILAQVHAVLLLSCQHPEILDIQLFHLKSKTRYYNSGDKRYALIKSKDINEKYTQRRTITNIYIWGTPISEP